MHAPRPPRNPRSHVHTPHPTQSLPAPLHEKKPGPHISPSPTPYPNTCTNEPTHLTPTHLFTYSPTHLPTYPPTHLPTYPPTHLPTYPPTHLPTYPPTHLPTYPPTHLPTYPPTHPHPHSYTTETAVTCLLWLRGKQATRPVRQSYSIEVLRGGAGSMRRYKTLWRCESVQPKLKATRDGITHAKQALISGKWSLPSCWRLV